MKVGLVILNYNDYESTSKLITLTSNFSEIDHIVVVDNCSPNESYKKLQENKSSTWDLIQTTHNGGYAFGNNVGAKFLIEKYGIDIIGFSNPDVSFDNAFISTVKQDFIQYKKYAIITGVELEGNGSIAVGSFWRKRAWWNICKPKFYQSMIGIGQELKQRIKCGTKQYVLQMVKSHQSVFPVDVVVGSLFFIRAKDFLDIGGFDEGTFLFMEEDILAARVQNTGKLIGVNPNIFFTHLGSTSVNSIMSQLQRKQLQLKSEKYFLDYYIHPGIFGYFLFETKKIISIAKLCIKKSLDIVK